MLKTARKMFSTVMICTMFITFMPFVGEGYAFAKSDSKPGKIASVTVETKSKAAKISWSKSKNAKKYQVRIMLGKKKIKALTTKKRTVTVKKLKNNKTYTAYVRGINGKKTGKWKTKRFKPGRATQPVPAADTPKPATSPSGQEGKNNDTNPEEPPIDNLKDDVVDKGDLHHLSEQGVINVSYGESGTVDFIDGAFTNEKVNNADDAIWVLDETTAFLNGFSAESSNVDEVVSEDDETFYRFSPQYCGLRVIGSQVILSADADGTVTGLTSSFNREFNDDDDYYLDTDPEITEEVAKQAAISDVLSMDELKSIYEKMQMQESDFVRCFLNVTDPELVIYAADEDESPRLVYQVSVSTRHEDGNEIDPGSIIIDPESTSSEASVSGTDQEILELPLLSRTYFINASSNDDIDAGSIYKTQDELGEYWTDTKVSASSISGLSGAYGDYKVSVQKQNDDYRAVDGQRNIKVYKTGYCVWDTTDIYGNTVGTAVSVAQMWIPVLRGTIASTEFKSNKKLENKAVYSMINIEKVYDFYRDVLERKSFDGKGGELNIFYDMHNRVLTSAAAWNTLYDAILIDEDSKGERGVDLLGHEYTHAVLEHINGGFGGNGEADALNEGYPDIMGNLIEGKTDAGRWKLGEDTNCYKYDMADSVSYVSQNGGHYNAGVFAHAAYLMMTDSRTSGISRDKWAKVFYKSMYYLPSDASFIQARRAILCAANRSGFDHDEQMAVREAFAEVGIREPQALRIVLNWGSEPEDLDSHLVGPRLDNDDNFHIYYQKKTYFDENQKKYVADLDYDDTTSYGPEVTTIHGKHPGVYYFFVHDFTTGTDSESEVMGNSGATVKVFKDGSNLPLDQVFNIRKGAEGTIWTVCKIVIKESGDPVITKIDRYGTEPMDENGKEIEVDYDSDYGDDDDE